MVVRFRELVARVYSLERQTNSSGVRRLSSSKITNDNINIVALTSSSLDRNGEVPLTGEGVSTFNESTKGTEYYGGTSTVALEALMQSQSDVPTGSVISLPLNAPQESIRKPDIEFNLDEARNFLDTYFNTIHAYIPVLHSAAFHQLFAAHFGPHSLKHDDNTKIAHAAPLLFSCLALGALYDYDRPDHLDWAKFFFAEAQKLARNSTAAVHLSGETTSTLGELPSSFEMVLTLWFLANYCQHTINPNSAYNYLGLAIRMAYSIGMHRNQFSIGSAMFWPGCSQQIMQEMRRRLWWHIYTFEVEMAIDTGRPMCIRNSDIDVDFPLIIDDSNTPANSTALTQTTEPCRVSFLRAMIDFTRLARKALKFAYPAKAASINLSTAFDRLATLDEEFSRWHASLPEFLVRADRDTDAVWLKRQRFSIETHLNHITIVLHRPFLTQTPTFDKSIMTAVEAAEDNIEIIHRILRDDPRLRSWSYWCHYCLLSTLIILTSLVMWPRGNSTSRYTRLCDMAMQIFQWMQPLEAATRSYALTERILQEWQTFTSNASGNGILVETIDKRRKRTFSDSIATSLESGHIASPELGHQANGQHSLFSPSVSSHVLLGHQAISAPPNPIVTALSTPNETDAVFSLFDDPNTEWNTIFEQLIGS